MLAFVLLLSTIGTIFADWPHEVDITNQCTDPKSHKYFDINETWHSLTDCEATICVLIPIGNFTFLDVKNGKRNESFAILKTMTCVDVQKKAVGDHCEMVPAERGVQYPDCCPIGVCIRANNVRVIKTGATGEVINRSNGIEKTARSKSEVVPAAQPSYPDTSNKMLRDISTFSPNWR